MAAMHFTPAQQDAIDVECGNILVSAAAGSGKTAVLTERVLRQLVQRQVPADRLIIVTFTVASSIEMKQRIADKLAAMVAQQPENQQLQEQQLLLSKARISTIHALCSELLRDHFQLLGLPAGWRIAEENELKILKADLLEEVIEQCYEEGSEPFMQLADFFSARDDRMLLETVTAVYDFIRSFPFPLHRLERFLQMYEADTPILETAWGKLVAEEAIGLLERAEQILSTALERMAGNETVLQKYAPAFENDRQKLRLVLAALQQGEWDRAVSILRGSKKMRLTPVRPNTDFLDELKALRKTAEELSNTVSEQLLLVTEQEHREDLQLLYPKMQTLFWVVERFYLALEQAKLEKSMIDFADLEHYTLRLLVETDGQHYRKTQTAKELSEQFYEIMVDECQDINQLQNLIFWALSKGSDSVRTEGEELLTDSQNLFLVGDVKQSIYRFRNAMPSLFLRRKKRFADYAVDRFQPGDCAKILLQNNFRSRSEVTHAVNTVFEQLMSEPLGELVYDETEALKASAHYPEAAQHNPKMAMETQLHLLDAGGLSRDAQPEQIVSLLEDKTDREAAYVAGLIRKMVLEGYLVRDGDGMRRCSYRDFCILLRSKKGKLERYLAKLREYQIEGYAESSSGYFHSLEISVMLNLLRIIDNPLQDIPLFSVLLSPMFGFSPDQVARIRLQKRKAPLYLGLCQMAQQGDEVCQEFLQTLSFLREQAVVQSVSKLIQLIYDRTGFLFVVESMISGEQKRANLRLLLEYAESYERIGYQGLDGFLRFIDKAIERDEDFSCANTVSERADVVRIMSIHASKGLEFPICIVADLGKQFHLRDLQRPYLLNGTLGFGMKIRKPEEWKEYSNLPLEAVRLAAMRESLSEELRVLYVAMTRAKEKLILVGTANGLEKQLQKLVQQLPAQEQKPAPVYLKRKKTPLSWILAALHQNSSLAGLFPEIFEGRPLQEQPIHCVLGSSEQGEEISEQELIFTAKPDPQILHRLQASMNFVYPDQELTKMPARITVTQLAKERQGEQLTKLEPMTLTADNGLTGAQRGTILHSFMQYADFLSARQDLEQEISRLTADGFLTAQQAKALNRYKIRAFLNSSLFARMLQADKLHREYQFVYEIGLEEVDPAIAAVEKLRGETVLMQGIADVVLEEADGIVIVDYKTDHLSSEDEFRQKYGDQLRIYRQALTEYFAKPVKQSLIYSLHLEREIEV